jgi:hypothetical protein
MMTREYPPEVYGGAGVHVTELVAQPHHLCEVGSPGYGPAKPNSHRQQETPCAKHGVSANGLLAGDTLELVTESGGLFGS